MLPPASTALSSGLRTCSRQKAGGGGLQLSVQHLDTPLPFSGSQFCCCGRPAPRGEQSQVGASFTKVGEEKEREWRRERKEGKRREGEERGGKEEKEGGESGQEEPWAR